MFSCGRAHALKLSMPIKSFRDLLVWQRAMSLVEGVYRVADAMPVVERYILAAELKRTSISLPSNIAEGRGRGRTGDFINHLIIALGSEAELQTQLELAVRLQLAPDVRNHSLTTAPQLAGCSMACSHRPKPGSTIAGNAAEP
jgi:four helix bundle protein